MAGGQREGGGREKPSCDEFLENVEKEPQVQREGLGAGRRDNPSLVRECASRRCSWKGRS